MSLTSLKVMWHDLLPSIVTVKPMTDLCEVFQANNYLIYKASNLFVVQKSHDACATITDLGKADGVDNINYSFDFTQQVHLPSNPMQAVLCFVVCIRCRTTR